MRTLIQAVCVAGGMLALSASASSAAVVCNEDGDCWRVKTRHEYRPEFRLNVYPDDWKWEDRDSKRYRWRERHDDSRGYWRKGVWIEF